MKFVTFNIAPGFNGKKRDQAIDVRPINVVPEAVISGVEDALKAGGAK